MYTQQNLHLMFLYTVYCSIRPVIRQILIYRMYLNSVPSGSGLICSRASVIIIGVTVSCHKVHGLLVSLFTKGSGSVLFNRESCLDPFSRRVSVGRHVLA